MARYFSAHTTACLTKQELRELMKRMLAAPDVKILRCVASQVGGRMVVEAEAPDQNTLGRWFESQNINCEWIMRLDLDARDGSVMEY